MPENKVKLIIEVSADDAKRVVEEFSGQVVEDVGKKTKDATEAGRLGFFALGNAVEDSARSMGVAGQASRQMGNSIERLAASSLPGFGTAIGVTVLAVTSVVQIVTQYIDRQQRLREELEKTTKASGEWTRANEKMSLGLMRADYNAYLLERRQNEEKLNTGIAEQERLIRQLTRATQEYITVTNIGDSDETRRVKQSPEKIAAARKELEVAEIRLNQMREEAKLAAGRPKSFLEFADQSGGTKEKDTTRALFIEESMMIVTAYEREAAASEAAAARIAASNALIAYTTEARSRVHQAANQAMENQLLRLVETHRFSVSEFGKAIMQQVKMELVGLAARASVYALFETAMGFATMFTNPAASAAHFTAAGEFAAVAGATLAAAAAVNAISGPGAQRPPEGTAGGYPVQTQNNPYSAPNPQAETYGSGWTPNQQQEQRIVVEIGVNDEMFNARVNKSVQDDIRGRGDTARVITAYT